jgi:hypothetical protein
MQAGVPAHLPSKSLNQIPLSRFQFTCLAKIEDQNLSFGKSPSTNLIRDTVPCPGVGCRRVAAPSSLSP